MKKSGLTTAGRPHDGNEFSGCNLQIDSTQSGNLDLADFVRHAQVNDL